MAAITTDTDTTDIDTDTTTTTGIAKGGRAAIVSTMRFPAFGAKVVKSFIDYHRSIGFVHFYLFFDGKCNSSFCSFFFNTRCSDDTLTLVLLAQTQTQTTVPSHMPLPTRRPWSRSWSTMLG